MHASIITFSLFVSFIHICLSVSSPEWIGSYNIDSSCNQAECCCVDEQATISKANDTHFLVFANVAGAPCQQQLSGATTVTVPLPIPTDKNGYQITTNFLGSNNRFTLSQDSQYIAHVNLQNPKCSGMARRMASNWIGTFKIGGSCNQDECCCLSEQARITKLSDTQLLVSASVAGTPCQRQLNGSTSVEVPISIPQDKNGFQITTTFLGSLNRFTLSYDNQYIAHVNLQQPQCSDMAKRADNDTSTASLISSTWIFILINALVFRMIYV